MNPSTTTAKSNAGPVYRIPPYHYIHVLDQNTNVTRLEIGPKTFIKQDNESVIVGPEKMITVPYVNLCFLDNKRQKKFIFEISCLDHVITALSNHQ